MGRTREFNIEQALDVAGELFWKRGYDRTSVADLTEAIGIAPPSFYCAFGSKAGLFDLVCERYRSVKLAYLEEALALPTSRQVVERLLFGMVDLHTLPDHPRGCMLLKATLSGADENDAVRIKLAAIHEKLRSALIARLARAVEEGDLPPGSDAAELTCFVLTVGRGTAFEAQSGASREQLQKTVAMALNSWPGA